MALFPTPHVYGDVDKIAMIRHEVEQSLQGIGTNISLPTSASGTVWEYHGSAVYMILLRKETPRGLQSSWAGGDATGI